MHTMQHFLRFASALALLAAIGMPAAAQTGGDPTIPDPQPWVRLGIANGDASLVDETTLHFGVGSAGSDVEDIPKIDDLGIMPLYIATLADDGTALAFNAFGPTDQEVVLPVRIRAAAADVYTITVLDLGTLAGVNCIALEDQETGAIIVLEDGLQIPVELPAVPEGVTRYKLRVFPPAQLTLQQPLCPHGPGGSAAVLPSGYGPWNYTWLNYEDLEFANVQGEEGPGTQGGLYPGAWTVRMEGLDGCGTREVSFEIIAAEEIAITHTAQAAACASSSDGSIQLEVSGGQAPFTFEWSNGAQSQDLEAVPAGAYHVTVADANGCSTTFTNLQVGAPDPIPGGIVAPSVVERYEVITFGSDADAGVERTWDFGDGGGSLLPEPVHAYQHLGEYTVRLTLTQDGCSTTVEQPILVQHTVGMDEVTAEDVRAWAAEGLIVVTNPLAVDLHVHVFDATGRIVTTTRLPAFTSRVELSTAGWIHGLYFLNASTPWEQWTFSLPVVE